MREGLSIVRQDGVLGYLPSPSSEELEGLTAGVDYFLGGRIYHITHEALEELEEMGFTAGADVVHEDDGYGDGDYGDEGYGD